MYQILQISSKFLRINIVFKNDPLFLFTMVMYRIVHLMFLSLRYNQLLISCTYLHKSICLRYVRSVFLTSEPLTLTRISVLHHSFLLCSVVTLNSARNYIGTKLLNQLFACFSSSGLHHFVIHIAQKLLLRAKH